MDEYVRKVSDKNVGIHIKNRVGGYSSSRVAWVVIPEGISFYGLHLVIQCLFGWENCHLHNTSIPSQNIFIEDEESSDRWDTHYPEETTLVEHFFPDYEWIRYTYDFGDDWRHKIFFEKIDESYKERHTALLKVKGDNFEENTGSDGRSCS